ncbi:hornerin-like isoform X2 [Gigantopelta aegis]|uniref:hornerin-like isoform X2 n=1 Tax=Gigantopelta aegis TaxID=1735272 RepID=UPI001B887BCE|nr:hornerin-like isoform X2 [Gigantopelta aegis]
MTVTVDMPGYTGKRSEPHRMTIMQYGDLSQGCKNTGPIYDPDEFHVGVEPAGYLGSYPGLNGKPYTFETTNGAQLNGDSSVIGHALMIFGGSSPDPIGCCVIGYSPGHNGGRDLGPAAQPQPKRGPFDIMNHRPLTSGGIFGDHPFFSEQDKGVSFGGRNSPKKHTGIFDLSFSDFSNLGSHPFQKTDFGGILSPSLRHLDQPPAPPQFPGRKGFLERSPLFGNVQPHTKSSANAAFGAGFNSIPSFSAEEKYIPTDGEETPAPGSSDDQGNHHDQQPHQGQGQGQGQGYQDNNPQGGHYQGDRPSSGDGGYRSAPEASRDHGRNPSGAAPEYYDKQGDNNHGTEGSTGYRGDDSHGAAAADGYRPTAGHQGSGPSDYQNRAPHGDTAKHPSAASSYQGDGSANGYHGDVVRPGYPGEGSKTGYQGDGGRTGYQGDSSGPRHGYQDGPHQAPTVTDYKPIEDNKVYAGGDHKSAPGIGDVLATAHSGNHLPLKTPVNSYPTHDAPVQLAEAPVAHPDSYPPTSGHDSIPVGPNVGSNVDSTPIQGNSDPYIPVHDATATSNSPPDPYIPVHDATAISNSPSSDTSAYTPFQHSFTPSPPQYDTPPQYNTAAPAAVPNPGTIPA